MNLPDFVLACPDTLALIVRAAAGELPRDSFDDAWDALEAEFPGGYVPIGEVETWMREHWDKPALAFLHPSTPPPTLGITPDYPVSRPLARSWMPMFLEKFVSTGGNATEAAESAGVHERTPYKAREADKTFAEAWEWAERRVADAIRAEIYRRSVEGWDEPQFGMLPGKGAGEGIVGAVRKFDSSLLIKMATARVPEYRTLVKEGAAQVSATANASATATAVVVPPEKLKAIQERNQRQLEKQAGRAVKVAGGNN